MAWQSENILPKTWSIKAFDHMQHFPNSSHCSSTSTQNLFAICCAADWCRSSTSDIASQLWAWWMFWTTIWKQSKASAVCSETNNGQFTLEESYRITHQVLEKNPRGRILLEIGIQTDLKPKTSCKLAKTVDENTSTPHHSNLCAAWRPINSSVITHQPVNITEA